MHSSTKILKIFENFVTLCWKIAKISSDVKHSTLIFFKFVVSIHLTGHPYKCFECFQLLPSHQTNNSRDPFQPKPTTPDLLLIFSDLVKTAFCETSLVYFLTTLLQKCLHNLHLPIFTKVVDFLHCMPHSISKRWKKWDPLKEKGKSEGLREKRGCGLGYK